MLIVPTTGRVVPTKLQTFAVLAVVALVPAACSANLPSSVRASIESDDTDPGELVINLNADVGGGCNVNRTYSIAVDTEVDGTAQVLTIGGHDYESDDGECTELATARARLPLDEGFLTGDLDTLRFELDGQENSFRLSVEEGSLRIEQIASSNVDLTCPETIGDLVCSTSSQ